ncbi:hypothetical protein ABVV53_03925 [Novosphingobium sp. RD2P27]|uniref:Uncharacterized protein n=1 Tax=Novosphingobium kalidii TaxID=3230299 RepID=A0ABV2CYX3_9SPHN
MSGVLLSKHPGRARQMIFAAALLSPWLLFFSANGHERESLQDRAGSLAESVPKELTHGPYPTGVLKSVPSFQPESAWQVHIERRLIIRVAPRALLPAPQDVVAVMPQRPAMPRFTERKIGKCLPVSGILGVEPSGASSLVLHMRDRRLISAELAKSCLSRSFYSGFYLSRSPDGMVCVNRDTLHSRSGTACKLSRIRRLVPDED